MPEVRVIGTKLGNYEIQRLIGEGGMGQVYLAVHPAIGRRAAIKVLTPGEVADPQMVSRFITEARAANAIGHPNIVDIYDCGVLGNGTPYIVMEYLEGETLTQVLQHGPIAVDDVLDWSCQVAEALAAAHAADVVHRDLKPDNLYLVEDARRLGKRQVKVLDFGIAKLQRQRLDQVHKTRTGSLLGTPLYMSPEQCMSQKDIGPPTDIYSLGVIVYEMATGRRPFDGEGVYAIISMHINEPPLPPSRVRPDVPPMLEEIILHALAKDPSARQPSMAVLHSQLELARGDAAASSEALARAQRARPPAQATEAGRSAAPGTLATLGDTAVSRVAAGQSTAGRARSRPWLLALAAAAALAGFAYWMAGRGRVAPAPIAAPSPVRAAPRPAPPQQPATVDIGLASDPAGASVFIGDVLVGKTPGSYRARGDGKPIDLVFRLDGFAPEHIRALPVPGLTVAAKLVAAEQPERPKRHLGSRRKHGARSPELAPSPSNDIQTER